MSRPGDVERFGDETLQDVMRQALESLGARDAPIAPRRVDTTAVASGEPSETADRRPVVTPRRAAPYRPSPRQPEAAPRAHTAATLDRASRLAPLRAGSRRRSLSVGSAIAIALGLTAALGAGYGLRALGQRHSDVAASAAAPMARIQVGEHERAAVSQTVAVLREIQSLSRPEVRYRLYFDRVAFAKSDVERHLAHVTDDELRRALDDTMALHLLAAAAWRARTLNEREKWEAVGDDRTSELCGHVQRVLSVGDEPLNMSRAQWRGHALAAALPLLWDCAGERLAAVERRLNQH